MKSSWSLALPFLYPLASALSSDETRVFLLPSSNKGSPNRGQKLDPETARLVFSRRLGLAPYYDVGQLGENQLEQICVLGGSSTRLFDAQHPVAANHKSQGFIVVESFDNVQDVIPTTLKSSSYDEFIIPTGPLATDTLELLKSFDDQLSHLNSMDTTIKSTVCDPIHDIIGKHGVSPLRQTCQPWSFSSISAKDSEAASDIRANLGRLLAEAVQHNYQFSVVFTPPTSKRTSKRSTNAYGAIASRQGKQEPELILSEATPIHSALSKPTQQAASSVNSSSPVRGILPSCFESEQQCESKTKGCSGHGECRLKYAQDKSECWTCACVPQVHKNSDGSTKTTNYGGSACQKKDIVVPFWLFTGFTIAILSVLTWAIGLLYSMGEETLPGVISAGVSGQVKK